MGRLIVGFLFGSLILCGQTAQINGIIKDGTGAAVPGASVKVTQTATGVTRTVTSATDGSYVLPNLPIGPYLLEVTKDGFNKSIQSGIVLQVNTSPTVDVTLQLGSVSTQVTVEAQALQVETRTTSIGQVVDNARIMELPLNGRDVHQLIFLAGMANFPGTAGLNSVRNYPTVVVTVAGGTPDAVAYNLDGVLHQDPYNNLSLPLPFPDAVQEFKVEWNAIPPQYGFHSTATVNTLTKSGTNQFHGDLFEFLRNRDLNANDFFNNSLNKPRDTLKRNQFGGTIGGPIRKDKLFFFGGYQRTSLRSDGTQQTAFIPTVAETQGDFSAIKTPLPTSLGFTAGNQISPSLLNPVALAIMKTMPQTTDPLGRVPFALVSNSDEDLYVAKVDYQLNSNQTVFGRFLSAKLNQSSTYDGKNPLSINSYGINDLDYGVALGHTWVISPTIVNSVRVGGNRTNVVKLNDNYKSFADLGANVSPLAGSIISVSVPGSFAIGGPAAAPGASHNGPLWSINDDVNWVKGAHQIGFGGSFYHQQLNYWSGGGVNASGAATFDGSVSGNPLADFLLGRTSTSNGWSQGTLYGFYSRQSYQALYIQDSWKVSPRLTLNYGVRWEPYTAVKQKTQFQDTHFDAALFAQNVHSTYYQFAPAGLVFNGDPQYPCGNAFNCPKWDKFFPRVGMAWDPQGNGRMTIRAAYGMLGDRQSMLSMSQEQFGAPFGSTISVPGANLSNPWANFGGGAGGLLPAGQNPLAILAARSGFGYAAPNVPFITAGAYLSAPVSNFHPTYVNQWNLSIQRQVGKDWLLSGNYLGNNTIHLVSEAYANPAVSLGVGSATGPCTLQTVSAGKVVPTNFTNCSTANANFRRVLYQQNPLLGQYYAGIGQVDDGGTANYEGLNLSARKQMSKGVNALVNYTWSHCISDQWAQNPTAGTGNYIPGERRAWRGNCLGLDIRQVFQFSMVATTPKFSRRALRLLASDWQFAPNLEIKSAQFFTVTAGTDRALSTVGNQTPNLVATDPYPSNQGVNNWISASSFAAAPLGSYGNLGYNNLKGPGLFQLNIAVSRNFVIHEKQTIQLRGEAFNLPNHLNACVPSISSPLSGGNFGNLVPLNSGNFGQITCDVSANGGLTLGDYRVIQMAMKFIF